MSEEETLYQRLGGREAICAVVDRFYERVLADERLAGFFEDADVERLRAHQTRFLAAVTGGPVEYTGESIRAAHAELDLRERHFKAVVTHLRRALEEFDVDDDAVEQVASAVAELEDDVLGS